MKRSEHVEQREFVQWWRRSFPDLWIFAVPNGGWRTPATALKLQLEGVSPGVPDLFIPAMKLFIEMKAEGGRLSEPQKVWIDYLEDRGYRVIVGYGFEDAKEKVLALGEALANEIGLFEIPPDAPIN
jgi:hypothetical protein